ncbi:MAG: hypothetical protein AB1847_03460 [bacterium]
MKKRFERMLILLLAFAFLSCPVLVTRAFAEEEKSPREAAGKNKIARVVLQAMGKSEALPDFQITFPTTIQDLIDSILTSDMVLRIQAARDERVQKRTERVEKWKDLFGRQDS